MVRVRGSSPCDQPAAMRTVPSAMLAGTVVVGRVPGDDLAEVTHGLGGGWHVDQHVSTRRVVCNGERSQRVTVAEASAAAVCAKSRAVRGRRCHISQVDTTSAPMSVASFAGWT